MGVVTLTVAMFTEVPKFEVGEVAVYVLRDEAEVPKPNVSCTYLGTLPNHVNIFPACPSTFDSDERWTRCGCPCREQAHFFHHARLHPKGGGIPMPISSKGDFLHGSVKQNKKCADEIIGNS